MRLLTILLGCAALAATLLSGASAPSFRDRIDYATPVSVSETVGDLNGDGIPDVLTCGGSAQAQIGNGDGTFTAGPLYNSGGIYCDVPLLIDLNGDGNLDLVISYYRDNTSGMAVAMGNGDGTFQPAATYQAGTDYESFMLTLGDFNNDGVVDVAVLGKYGVWVFLGQGAGVFSPGVLVPVNSPQTLTFSLAAADLNGDGNFGSGGRDHNRLRDLTRQRGWNLPGPGAG